MHSSKTLRVLPRVIRQQLRHSCEVDMGSRTALLFSWQQNTVRTETSDQEMTLITHRPNACRIVRPEKLALAYLFSKFL